MESLQHAWNDLVKRLRELPRRTQVLIAIAAVLCVLIFALVSHSGANNSEVELLPGNSLTVRQLSAYQVAFANAGLEEYQIKNQKIYVPNTKKANFMAALSKANLLIATSGKHLEKALNSSSPFENQQQQKQRIKIAKEKEFAQTISQFNGIEEATVQYDAEEKKGIRQEKICKASVTVRASNDQRLTVGQAQIIRKYLAGCIAGLEPEKIYIVDLNHSLEPTVLLKDASKYPATPVRETHNSSPQSKIKSNDEPDSFAAGAVAIVGSALIAGCVALLRRRNIPAEGLGSSSTLLDIEIPGSPVENDEPQISDVPISGNTFDIRNEASDDGVSKARLLLPGQSDYSHLVPDQQTDGIELTTLSVNSSTNTDPKANDHSSDDEKLPFEFVNQANPDDLFEILVDQSPQNIAIVFSHLSAEQSALVLSRLPQATQVQVLNELGNLSAPSKDTTRTIGNKLAKKLESIVKRNEKRKAGRQAVGDLLEFIDAEERVQLLEELQSKDAGLTSHLSSSTSKHVRNANLDSKKAFDKKTHPETSNQDTPEIILQLSGEDLCTLFAAVDPRDAVLALSHWDANITQRLTNAMQSEDVLRLEKSLRNTQRQNVHKLSSCRKVLKVAVRLNESGKINSAL